MIPAARPAPLLLATLALAAGCTCDDPGAPSVPAAPAPTPEGPAPEATAALSLARHADQVVEITLPPSTRGDLGPVPDAFSPIGAFQKRHTRDGVDVWAIPLPVHANLFPARQAGARSFGNFEPPGLTVSLRGERLAFRRHAHGKGTYGYDKGGLLVGLKAGSPPPTADDVVLTWPKAQAAEAALHLETSGLEPEGFALRTMVLGDAAHTGVFLPAPGAVTWGLTVPEDGRLGFRATLLPPAIAAARPSDGATLVVDVRREDGTALTETVGLTLDTWTSSRVDLSAFAGEHVTLTLRSDPGGDAVHDLVFVEDPAVYTPTDDPRRVVALFLDTVRRDHLGMYGYARPTTPKLDAWAEGAVRFDDHRTVAPWTLPSTRAALSGHQPEAWFEQPTLAEHLAGAGFHAEGIVANAYLSPVFAMHRGFGRYTFDLLRPADRLVDDALAVLEEHDDRDVFLLVQFMEAHLPYREGKDYRGLFEPEQAPKGHEDPSRWELVKIAPDDPKLPRIKTYVEARYDQNLRRLDDEVSRLLATLDEDDVVVIFSDHGEEFWDHGAFEHGHAFFDELVRTPMIVKGPGLPPGAVNLPTSLLDLTPTVLDLAGLDADLGGPGVSLVPAVQGRAAARKQLQDRPQGLGRPLYGADAWGVVVDRTKWLARGGTTRRWDLEADPGETTPLRGGDDARFADALQDALDVDVHPVWRVTLRPRRGPGDIVLTLAHPDGLEAAWGGYDPRGYHDGVRVEAVDGRIVVTQPEGALMHEVLYVQPRTEGVDPAGLEVTLTGAGEPASGTVPEGVRADGVLLDGLHPRWGIRVDHAWVPEPTGTAVRAYDAGMEEALKALGYVE